MDKLYDFPSDLHSLAFDQHCIQHFPYRILSLTPTRFPPIDPPRRIQFLQQVTSTTFLTSLTHGYQPQPPACTFLYQINASSTSSTNLMYRHQPQISAYRSIERKLYEPHEPAPTPDISIFIPHIDTSSASTVRSLLPTAIHCKFKTIIPSKKVHVPL